MADQFKNLLMTPFGREAVTSTKGKLIDTINSKLAGWGHESNCRFYYSGAGGSLINYLVKRYVVGGTISLISNSIKNEFNHRDKEKQKTKTQKEDPDIEEFGSIKVRTIDNKEGVIYALDDWGYISPDALMLGIETDTEIEVQQKFPSHSLFGTKTYNHETSSASDGSKINRLKTKTLVWYDTTALISISSDKNMVITPVQGRDFSRKELISNGDIKFNVTGQITSNKPDVYPTHDVQKFLKVMQYKGVVRVHNQLLSQFGITHIVIDNFSLNSQEGSKSVQRYSFSALGLQPETKPNITEDTIEIQPMRIDFKGYNKEDKWADILSMDTFKEVGASALGAIAQKILSDQLSEL